jgi:hypothetical protein
MQTVDSATLPSEENQEVRRKIFLGVSEPTGSINNVCDTRLGGTKDGLTTSDKLGRRARAGAQHVILQERGHARHPRPFPSYSR